MAYLNKLPLEFLDLNEMGTQSRGVSVLYGRRADGSLVAVNVADDGTLSINTTATISASDIQIGAVEIKDGDSADLETAARVRVLEKNVAKGTNAGLVVNPQGSTNAYFADQTTLALTGAFQQLSFGFTSFNITFLNDSAITIEASFNGTNVHHRFKPAEGMSWDYRAQPSIWLRTTTVAGNYRISAY